VLVYLSVVIGFVVSSVTGPHRKNADTDANADPGENVDADADLGCGCGFMPLLNYGEPSNGIRNL
jgi:hypothetical protein